MEPEKTDTSITDLKRLNEQLEGYGKLLIRRDLELNRANESLRALDHVKSEFVSRVTHQLRTPLSGMKWALWMLISGEVGTINDEQRVFVMKIYESNERMIRLINDVGEADKLESGTVPFRIQQTQVVDLLENVLTEMEILARKRDITLDLLPHGDIPLIPIDPENMRVVLQNLIENAIKYSQPGQRVKIAIRDTGTVVEISVADSGIGIPKADQKSIFARFYRAENAVRYVTDSSGLGLYIVHTIIKRHNGTIRFESEENAGATFFVTLPKTPVVGAIS